MNIKFSINHVAVLGDRGQLPPCLQCSINALCFYDRLQNLNSECIVKDVFGKLKWQYTINVLCNSKCIVKDTYGGLKIIHELGFSNWVTEDGNLAFQFNVHLNATKSQRDILQKMDEQKNLIE